MSEQAPVVYGKYQLLELLARGGMAEVFKAKSHGVEGFEKILVIKRILPELSRNPQFVDMFINEAKIAVTLSHANIVQVFDLGRADETYFIAMEYVTGYDLATILRRGRRFGRPLPAELAVFIVSELAKGLDYAHRRRDANMRPLNIVHRDVSPQNVLVSFEGEVKLTDFGIAKARTIVDEDTEVGVLKGKYAYMSPEQATSGEVDSPTDLYALGVVLYEALAGKNPFDAESTYEILRRVRRGDAPPLTQLVPGIPEELASIVSRAMAADPADRHANAGRLYEELVQFLYSSGRRVGGHDLAQFVNDLREVSQASGRDRDEARLRADFADGSSQVAYAPDATPVEVPVSRASSRVRGAGESSEGTGRKVSTGVRRPTAERRDVSVLVLSTDSVAFMNSDAVARQVNRFAGTMLKEPPPAGGMAELTVLFGLREPDGRDTESAARCALRLLRAAAGSTQVSAPEATVRIAVHSGRILVDMTGEPIRDEALNKLRVETRALATRAAAGQTLVSPHAQRVIAGLFSLLPHGDGASPPFLLEDERSLPDASGRFVGRRDELRQMGEILALANRGRTKMLGLEGDAGVGKTRLLLETRRRLRLGGHDVGIYVATCPRHSRTSPLVGIQEMLRAVLAIEEFDPEEEIKNKINRLRELGLGAQDITVISAVLGVGPAPEGGESLLRLLRPVLMRMTQRLAEDRLTVFAFDAAESMDDESMGALDALLRDGRDTRAAVVLAYRPGFVHVWQDHPSYRSMVVGPMSDDDVARLTATRLGAEEVPLDLLREVSSKSGGNPLYVEEYLKALSDAGAVDVTQGHVRYEPAVAEVEVPKTLRGIVSSRLARLGATDRHLLQVAAVAGARFTPELLAEVAGEELGAVQETLAALESKGLVTRSTEGGTERSFAHELVGEVLRDGLTLDTRREIHRAVALAHELLYANRLDEFADRLAAHWREAGERGRAVDYLERAAERYAIEHASAAATQALDRAIDLLSQMATPDRERTLRAYRRIGEICWKGGEIPRGIERMATAVELAESLGREDWVARFALLRGRLMVVSYRVEEARRWLDRAGDIARRLEDESLFRDIVLATAEAYVRLGDHQSSIQYLDQARGLAEAADDRDAQVRCLVPLALAHATAGDRQRGLESIQKARALIEGKPDPYTECELLKMESIVLYYLHDYAAAIETATSALELSKEYTFTYESTVNAHNIGDAYLRLGDYKRAFASLRYSYELARDHGYEPLMMQNMCMLGFIDAVRFGSEEGRAHVAQANEYAVRQGLVWVLIQGLYYLAMIDQQRGDEEGARTALRECLRVAAEHGHVDYVQSAERAMSALDAGETIKMPA